MTINLHHGDCVEAMAKMPDKAYDLAIVDPPYGLDKRLSSGGGKHRNSVFRLQYLNKNWDAIPPIEYFDQLFRISSNQIIWGGNYFKLPPTRGIICWDKKQMMQTFSRWELGWTSFDCPSKMIAVVSTDDNRIHPTQKPVKLYEWLLRNYAKEGDKILDTHLGSGSIAIACYNMGFSLDGYELDKDYYEAAVKRLNNHKAQGTLFTPKQVYG